MVRKLVRKTLKKSGTTIKIDIGAGFIAVVAIVYLLYTLTASHHPHSVPVVQEYTGHQLVRIPGIGWFGGVLAGFAYYFSVPIWTLRLGFVLVWLLLEDIGDALVVAYILFWIFMPAIHFIPADLVARIGG